MILVLSYFIKDESQETREMLPTAMILAFSTALALSLWVTIYICFIYQSDDDTVEYGTGDKKTESNYTKMSKEWYLFLMLFGPILNITFYLMSYSDAKNWNRRNLGY